MYSCNDNTDKRTQLEYVNVENYGSFCIGEKGTTVIKDSSDFNALWAAWNNYADGGKSSLPYINFDSQMVIVVHYGVYYQGCTNAVEVIKSIETDGDKIFINIGDLPNLGLCDAGVYPLHMVQLESLEMDIIFEGKIP